MESSETVTTCPKAYNMAVAGLPFEVRTFAFIGGVEQLVRLQLNLHQQVATAKLHTFSCLSGLTGHDEGPRLLRGLRQSKDRHNEKHDHQRLKMIFVA